MRHSGTTAYTNHHHNHMIADAAKGGACRISNDHTDPTHSAGTDVLPRKCQSRPYPDPHTITNAELATLCNFHGIRLTIPYSQLEAEAVLRGVPIEAIIREQLIHDLRKVGAL